MIRDEYSAPAEDNRPRPSRRRALELMALSVSSPLLAQLLSACGTTPAEPMVDGTDDPDPSTPDPEPKPVKVLFVPGFMSELYTAVSKFEEQGLNEALRAAARKYLNYDVVGAFGNVLYHVDVGDRVAALIDVDLIPDGGLVSFHTQMADFVADDTDFHDITQDAGFDSSDSVEHNAEAIAAYLQGVTDHVVVIVSHSKGGLDTLHALIEHPELIDEPVVGWVALQGPFYGSPVASVAPSLGDLILTQLGGGPALSDLSPDVREAYMSDHATAVADLGAAIPVLSCSSTYDVAAGPSWASYALTVFDGSLVKQILDLIASKIAADPLHLLAALALSATQAIQLINLKIATTLDDALARIGLMDTTNAAMNALAMANDGLVPRDSTRLPASTAVDLNVEVAPGDHAAPVMITAPLKEFWMDAKRNALTRELIGRVSPAEG